MDLWFKFKKNQIDSVFNGLINSKMFHGVLIYIFVMYKYNVSFIPYDKKIKIKIFL